jgi:hypothetical protein
LDFKCLDYRRIIVTGISDENFLTVSSEANVNDSQRAGHQPSFCFSYSGHQLTCPTASNITTESGKTQCRGCWVFELSPFFGILKDIKEHKNGRMPEDGQHPKTH